METKKMPREDRLFGMSCDDHEPVNQAASYKPTFSAGKVIRTYVDDIKALLEKLQKEQKSLSLQPSARCRVQIALCRIKDELTQLESASHYADKQTTPDD